jgi:hypothetical protein
LESAGVGPGIEAAVDDVRVQVAALEAAVRELVEVNRRTAVALEALALAFWESHRSSNRYLVDAMSRLDQIADRDG